MHLVGSQRGIVGPDEGGDCGGVGRSGGGAEEWSESRRSCRNAISGCQVRFKIDGSAGFARNLPGVMGVPSE